MSTRAGAGVEVPTPGAPPEAGAATEMLQFRRGSQVQLVGTFVGTYQLQYRIYPGAWVNTGSPLSAPGIVDVPDAALEIRWNATAYTSGTPSSHVGGVVAY